MRSSPDTPADRSRTSRSDPTGSRLSDADWLEWARSADQPLPLGMLGPYELLEEIGHGAQGTVYRARQPGTRRDVVIKRLSAGSFATASMRARFDREIEALSALKHPCIVAAHAAERVDGQPILIMEWVEGCPINRWARGDVYSPSPTSPAGSDAPVSTRRPLGEILGVFALVCDAVAHAHHHGVLHRDLKPSNILVDSQDRPRVLDFGLAKLLATEGEGGTGAAGRSSISVTGVDGFVGTPAYASAEQVSGGRNAVDTRSDVYSLGVVLYELVTGAWPFAAEGETDPPPSLPAVFDAVRRAEPRRPSRADRRIGPELEAILLKAIARNPDARYQSADALAADLRRLRNGEPVLAHPLTTAYQFRKLVSRHQMAFVVGATVALLIVALAIVSTVLGLRLAKRQRDLVASQGREHDQLIAAQAARARAEQQSAKVKATNAFLQQLLITDDPTVKLSSETRLRELLAEASHSLDDWALQDEPEVEAAVRTTIGRTYTELRMASLGEPHLRRAFDLRSASAETSPLEMVETTAQLALCLCEQRKFAEGIPLHEFALSTLRALATSHDETFIRRLMSLGTALRDFDRFERAEAVSREALSIAEDLYGPNHRIVAESRFRLGLVLSFAGKLDEAEQQFRDALASQRELLGSDHPACGETLIRLGQTLVRKQRNDEGLETIREGVDVLTRSLGEVHPNTMRAASNYADYLSRCGRYEEAEKLFAATVNNCRAYYTYPTATESAHMLRWARDHWRQGDYEGAINMMRDSLDMLITQRGDDHPDVEAQRLELARWLVNRRCYGDAEILLNDARAMADRSDAEDADARRSRVSEDTARLYAEWCAATSAPEVCALADEWEVKAAAK